MSRSDRKPELVKTDWRTMLMACPVRNVAAETDPAPDGGLWITVRKARAPWHRAPWKWIVPGGDRRRIVLDSLGREVWDLCDGERTVEHIVDEMARRYRLSFHEARTAVTELLKELVRRGALAILLPAQESDPSGQRVLNQ